MFDPKLYDFIDPGVETTTHENYEDIISDKLFKYRYKQNADSPQKFEARMKRVTDRFLERAKTRDSVID